MTAIASGAHRLTPKVGEALGPQRINIAVTATKEVKAGGMVMLVPAGTCEPGAAGTGNVCLGIAQRGANNSASLSPAPVAEIETGNFPLAQTGTTITAAHIGTTCYMADDQTVTLSSSGNSPAGTVVGIGDDGTSVIVAISPLLPISASGFSLQSRTLTIDHGAMTAAPDTDNTNFTSNIGAALPAGAVIVSHVVHLVTPFSGGGVATLALSIGDTTDATSIMTTFDMLGSAGYSRGTVGDYVLDASQLLATVNPDASTKTSDLTAGEVKITVWFLDGTDY